MNNEDNPPDPGYLQEEANRIGSEKLQPLVEQLEEELHLKYTEGADKKLLDALIKALMEGVWLGTSNLAAEIETQHGIKVDIHKHFNEPDEPEATTKEDA
jgi:hypothetical protein